MKDVLDEVKALLYTVAIIFIALVLWKLVLNDWTEDEE